MARKKKQTAFKWTEKREKDALSLLESYEGLPHIHRRAIPGRGIDCIYLVMEALKAGGLNPENYTVPGYTRTQGFGLKNNSMECIFQEHYNCDIITNFSDIRTGDIGIARLNRSCNHMGIFMGKKFWECLWDSGVGYDEPESAKKYLQSIVRINSIKK